jgi:hypothetical protein
MSRQQRVFQSVTDHPNWKPTFASHHWTFHFWIFHWVVVWSGYLSFVVPFTVPGVRGKNKSGIKEPPVLCSLKTQEPNNLWFYVI